MQNQILTSTGKDHEPFKGRDGFILFQPGFSEELVIHLPNDGDYQSHRMEIRIPELPVGFYILIASSDPDFKDTNQVITWAPFYSTRISFISQRNEKSEEDFYILDRETGIPLEGVIAEAFHVVYNYTTRKNENQKTGEYVSR